MLLWLGPTSWKAHCQNRSASGRSSRLSGWPTTTCQALFLNQLKIGVKLKVPTLRKMHLLAPCQAAFVSSLTPALLSPLMRETVLGLIVTSSNVLAVRYVPKLYQRRLAIQFLSTWSKSCDPTRLRSLGTNYTARFCSEAMEVPVFCQTNMRSESNAAQKAMRPIC